MVLKKTLNNFPAALPIPPWSCVAQCLGPSCAGELADQWKVRLWTSLILSYLNNGLVSKLVSLHLQKLLLCLPRSLTWLVSTTVTEFWDNYVSKSMDLWESPNASFQISWANRLQPIPTFIAPLLHSCSVGMAQVLSAVMLSHSSFLDTGCWKSDEIEAGLSRSIDMMLSDSSS